MARAKRIPPVDDDLEIAASVSAILKNNGCKVMKAAGIVALSRSRPVEPILRIPTARDRTDCTAVPHLGLLAAASRRTCASV